MRFRNTLIVAILFAALGAWIYFGEFERIRREELQSKLFAIDRDRVVRVELAYPDRTIVVVKRNGQWRIEEPLDTEASPSAMENLIRAVVDAEVKRRLDDPPEDLQPFGLDEPQATVILGLNDGSSLPAARVGKTSPVGSSTFVQLAGENHIVLLPSSFGPGVDKTVLDLREKSIFDFVTTGVRSIDITGEDGPVRLARKDDEWTIEKPEALEADPSEIRSFLSSLASLKAERFVDEPEDLEAYGLAPPQRTIALELGDGDEPRRLELLVGAPAELDEKKGIYVKRPDRETVFHVGSWTRKTLAKSLQDFRDKTVLVFDPDAVQAVVVARRDGSSFRLERRAATEGGATKPDDESAGASWTLDGAPVAMEGRVDNLLNDLHTLEGRDIVAEDPESLEPWGLEQPELIFTLFGEDERTIGEISVTQQNRDEEKTYATSGDSPFVYQLHGYLYSHLDKRPEDFAPEETAGETGPEAVQGE